MRQTSVGVVVLVLSAAVLGGSGCSGEDASEDAPRRTRTPDGSLHAAAAAGQEHSGDPDAHADRAHEHHGTSDGDAHAEGHAHAHTAPHGGVLAPIGEHFAQVELVLEPSLPRLTAFVLDGCAEQAIPISQETLSLRVIRPGPERIITLQAVANELTGETVGDTSEFAAEGAGLADLRRFSGELLEIEIDGHIFRAVPVAFSREGE